MSLNKEKNFISVVLYVYNDANKIYEFFELIEKELLEKFEKIEFICVNDDSTDNSVEEIKRYSQTARSTITILNMSYHQGVELALNAGVDLAIGDFVYEFESVHLSYPLELVWDIYVKAVQGFDIVAASPEKMRERSSAWFYYLYNRFSDSQYKLQTEVFRVVSRRAINRVKSMTKMIPYRKAVYANCGLKKATLTFELNRNLQKRDRQQKKDYNNIAIDAFILYTDLAFKWSMAFSGLMMAIMIGVGVYTLIVHFQGNPVAGWSSTILFLAFTFFGLFAILTAIIKYLALILRLNFNRLNYVIESIVKIK